ncbi:hypothetical protein [Paenibacillus naphthalenovorans]|uniref:hypothetical protein n=1 Tax=Paenibacillus naphthalenovorans TaxID=162209 RepID=UPI00088B9444|nr:hypothetical protein [Paenibacillus naphthalenovorans]SDI50166.1 hypothetical protein SAMN05421868_10756 [Paenibacillus naphthalenovorans]
MSTTDKREAIKLAYQIATLNEIPADLLDELARTEYIRVLEVLLVLRQSPNPIKAPANFVRSALRNGWKPNDPPIKQRSHSDQPEPARYSSFYEQLNQS